VTEKASPPTREEGAACPPEGSTIVKGSYGQNVTAAALPPLREEVAVQSEKITVPKSASGRTVLEVGASATHSADAREAAAAVV
jgi:hypothetical protein